MAATPEKPAEYDKVIDQNIDDMNDLPNQKWTMGRLKQHLKGTKSSPTQATYRITFQSKIQKTLSADLFEFCGLNFDASARRKADEANVLGLKGVGLTVIDGDYHSFVGIHQPLNLTVEKAVKFRKIILQLIIINRWNFIIVRCRS